MPSRPLPPPAPPPPAHDDDDGITTLDEVDFGYLAGSISLAQLSYGAFNDRCKTQKAGDEVVEEEGDCTGQRIYTGAQIMVRLIYKCPWLVKGQRVVELGCGVGAVGLLASRLGPTCVVLTDGRAQTLELTRRNVAAFQASASVSSSSLVPHSALPLLSIPTLTTSTSTTSTSTPPSLPPSLAVHQLQWDSHAAFVDLFQQVDKFDVVIGTELMYYNVDAMVALRAATWLLDGNVGEGGEEGGGGGEGEKWLRDGRGGEGGEEGGGGEKKEQQNEVNKCETETSVEGTRRKESGSKGGLILLAHIFRDAHLPYTLAAAAQSLGWTLLQVPMDEVLSEEGEGGREGGVRVATAEWWGSVCVLVGVREGGREGGVEGMLARLPRGSRVFVPYGKEEGGGEDEEEEGVWRWQGST